MVLIFTMDTLVDELTKEFDQHSIFAKADWDDPVFTADKKGMTPEAVGAMVKGQIRYNIHAPKIGKDRKMLTTGLIRFLIREEVLKEEDPEIMAAQFAWPISMWMALCDREPEREAEAMELVDKHIRQFFRVYGK